MAIDRSVTLAILRVLHQCQGYTLTEEVLFQQVTAAMPQPITMAWMRQHLQICYDKGYVDFHVDQIDEAHKYFIKDAGKLIIK